MKEAVAVVTWLAVVVFGILVPIVLGILIWCASNPVVATGDAGRFVSSVGSAGGFFSPGVTTVQTGRGSIAVFGQFSALRGQPLKINRAFNGDTNLCVGPTQRMCADLASDWPGTLQPVPYQRPLFGALVTGIGANAVSEWLLAGIFAGLVATAGVVIVAGNTDAGDESDADADGERESC